MADRTREDVRIRLSAEGQQEVVNAFLKVQKEAEEIAKRGRGAGAGIDFLGGALARLGRLLPALSFGAAVAGFTLLTKRALENADAMGKMQQKTGIAVETLSTLSFASRTADLSQESLNGALIRLVRTFDDYDKGTKKARDGVRSLFGSQKALEGLDTEQRLRKVFEAIAKLEPGAKRTGAAVEFLGRSGAELLPLLDDLAEGGFEKARAKAEALGLVIDQDLALAAQRANDAMTDLRSLADGVATQFASTFVPALETAAEALVQGLSGDGTAAFRELGKIAGEWFQLVVRGLFVTGQQVKAFFQDVAALGRGAKGLFNALVFGEGSVADVRTNLKNELDKINADVAKRTFEFDVRLSQGSDIRRAQGPRRRRDDEVSENEQASKDILAERERRAKAERALREQLADNELAILRAGIKAQEADAKRGFDEGLTSLENYYAERRRLIEQEVAREIAVLSERLEFERTRPLLKDESELDRQKAVAQLENQIAVLRINSQTQLAALSDEQRRDTRELARQQIESEAQLLAAQGRRFEAARRELDAQVASLERLKGESDESFANRQQIIRDAGEARIRFDEIQSRARQAMAELDIARRDIEIKVERGIITEIEGQEQLAALELDRLPVLREIARTMRAAAEALADPEQIAAAREFEQALDSLGISANRLQEDIQAAISSDLENFFSSSIDQAKSFGDAMRILALDVVASLRRIAAQMLVNLAISRLLGGIFGAFGGGGGSVLGDAVGGGPIAAASGGYIRGPGSGTSDSIPAWLSNGEFVIRAAAVRHIGRETLEAINRGADLQLRRMGEYRRGFAEGGLVETGGTGGGAGHGDLLVGLDEGLILRRLEQSRDFPRLIVRTLDRNRNAMNTALGRPR